MSNLIALAALAALILFIVGIFAPQKALFWHKGQRTRTKSALIYGIGFLVLCVIFSPFAPNTPATATSAQTAAPAPKAKADIEILQMSGGTNEIGATIIHCRVKNNTDKLAAFVGLQATFFDKEGKIVGTGIGNTSNFAAGAERTIDVMAMNVENIDKYEVQVENTMFQ